MPRQLLVRLAIAGLGIVGLATTASAADIGAPAAAPVYTKAPVMAPFSWTGFYIGGNVGYGWGTSKDDPSFTQTNGGTINFASLGASDSNKLNGVIGGAQAGYNWQVSNFVVGVETDIQSGQKGTDTFAAVIINGSLANAGNNPATVTDTTKLDWFGTTRARLGYATDHWLVYGTGGVAYGEVRQTSNIQPANPLGSPGQNAPIVGSQSSTKVGWAAGLGVENAITRNWSWKVEYLYMDLGTATANLSGGLGTGFTAGLANCYGATAGCNFFRAGASGTVSSHVTDNIVRVGVNYRFD